MEKNINAARQLLEKYKSITLEMITETWERIKNIINIPEESEGE